MPARCLLACRALAAERAGAGVALDAVGLAVLGLAVLGVAVAVAVLGVAVAVAVLGVAVAGVAVVSAAASCRDGFGAGPCGEQLHANIPITPIIPTSTKTRRRQ